MIPIDVQVVDHEGHELTRDDIAERVQQLRTLVLADENLKKMRTDDSFLLRFLQSCKFIVELAAKRMVSYYEMIDEYPDWFKINSPEENRGLLYRNMRAMLTQRDKEGRGIYVVKLANINPSKVTMKEVVNVDDLWLESIMDDPMTQCKGLSVIIDISGYSLKLFQWLTPSNIKFGLTKMDTLPVKDIVLHVVNTSFLMSATLKLIWPLLSQKIKDSVKFHYNDLDSLHNFIDPDSLPTEYGGKLNVNYEKLAEQLIARNNEIVEKIQYLNYIFENMHIEDKLECSQIAKVLKQISHGSIEYPCLDREWQERAEEELKETPERYKQELAALKALVLNDTNLNVPKEDAFLTRFLRARKFDNKKAFNMLQRYYLMKLKCPELFQCPLPSEIETVFELQAQTMLSDRDQHGRRIYVIRVDNFDSSKVTIDDIFRTNIMALEQIVREPETQISGLVVVLDMAGLSLNHAKFFTPYYAKKMVELVQETFPLRFKGFHVVNEPFYFDAIMAVLKPFMKEKIRKRIYLHGNDLTSLHAFLNTEILPLEYGGTNGTFDNRAWKMQLLKDEDYFRSLKEYGYKVEIAEEIQEN
ncbi:PREDICTED: clavesin-1-like [Nicrophorus vespilloides]|uniref:Clavesin-1-like n=1 Tax=Nicrophorus vespilloides TaxID=110193 RepID=A0ABM1MB89_NICVS|nr:PREDICTED: clavesin-1-like [Nicrophorus vespilloides]